MHRPYPILVSYCIGDNEGSSLEGKIEIFFIVNFILKY